MYIMEQRECKYCKQAKDLTPSNFYADRTMCKECVATRRRDRYCGADKDVILDKQKQYYDDNKEKITEQRKQYRESNQDKIKQQNEANKDRYSEIVKCECGAEMRKYSLSRHLKNQSGQHENYIRRITKA